MTKCGGKMKALYLVLPKLAQGLAVSRSQQVFIIVAGSLVCIDHIRENKLHLDIQKDQTVPDLCTEFLSITISWQMFVLSKSSHLNPVA